MKIWYNYLKIKGSVIVQLSDHMIEQALKDTVYMSESPWILVGVLSFILLALVVLFIKNKGALYRIGCVLLATTLIILSIKYINKKNNTAEFISNGEWIVVTDVVDRVMESTENGNKDYFMVLEKYGRVSLESYSDAMQYYSGAKVYVVVVPDGSEYKSTGVTYSTEIYTYVGNH